MTGQHDSPLTPEQIAAVKDQDIDFSDIPELDEEFWEQAEGHPLPAQQSQPRPPQPGLRSSGRANVFGQLSAPGRTEALPDTPRSGIGGDQGG